VAPRTRGPLAANKNLNVSAPPGQTGRRRAAQTGIDLLKKK
jgi:hypothetical protein